MRRQPPISTTPHLLRFLGAKDRLHILSRSFTGSRVVRLGPSRSPSRKLAVISLPPGNDRHASAMRPDESFHGLIYSGSSLTARRANQARCSNFSCRVLFFGFSEIFPSRLPQISLIFPASRPARGALAIVTNVGMGCGGRGSVRRET
jgi:hypothetical protein